ncbi:hypothetical protein B5V00_06550 [Geothermobacter hydrogeniphilus]|uniref:Response regulatory domain-containing protein n=1 Tax=Geothermobacter hydrogeniphilus TaxID=1969733 RepID=A0A1X0Y7V9_9BACT|nr:hypothetical protein B5V00_06550 [Geothermobacter hydrogeniphilus]
MVTLTQNRMFNHVVLVADDNPPARDLLSLILAEQNCKAITANNGFEAWQILQETQVDLLVVELDQVPGECRGGEDRLSPSFQLGWRQAMTSITDSGVPCYLSIGRPPSIREMVAQIRLLLQDTPATTQKRPAIIKIAGLSTILSKDQAPFFNSSRICLATALTVSKTPSPVVAQASKSGTASGLSNSRNSSTDVRFGRSRLLY